MGEKGSSAGDKDKGKEKATSTSNSYKIEQKRGSGGKSTPQNGFEKDKDEEFDQLLNDFKNYKVTKREEDQVGEEAEDEWL